MKSKKVKEEKKEDEKCGQLVKIKNEGKIVKVKTEYHKMTIEKIIASQKGGKEAPSEIERK